MLTWVQHGDKPNFSGTHHDRHVLHSSCLLAFEPLVILDAVDRVRDGYFDAVFLVILRRHGLPFGTAKEDRNLFVLVIIRWDFWISTRWVVERSARLIMTLWGRRGSLSKPSASTTEPHVYGISRGLWRSCARRPCTNRGSPGHAIADTFSRSSTTCLPTCARLLASRKPADRCAHEHEII